MEIVCSLNRGGALIYTFSNITFTGRSTVTFDGNEAYDGGAVYGESSVLAVSENLFVTFTNNSGTEGGAIHFKNGSGILVGGSSLVIFNANSGGAVYFRRQCCIAFESNSLYKVFHDQKSFLLEARKSDTVTAWMISVQR